MNWEICTRKKRQMLRKNDVAETDRIQGKEGKGLPLDEDGYLTGSTGCGLCALYRMKQVGITHLKAGRSWQLYRFYGKGYKAVAESSGYFGKLRQ